MVSNPTGLPQDNLNFANARCFYDYIHGYCKFFEAQSFMRNTAIRLIIFLNQYNILSKKITHSSSCAYVILIQYHMICIIITKMCCCLIGLLTIKRLQQCYLFSLLLCFAYCVSIQQLSGCKPRCKSSNLLLYSVEVRSPLVFLKFNAPIS